MRKHYDLENSKNYKADFTKVTQLQFLYSCSLSFPIVEFKIPEISSIARNLQSQFKIYAAHCFARKNLLAQFQVFPLHSFEKKNLLNNSKYLI